MSKPPVSRGKLKVMMISCSVFTVVVGGLYILGTVAAVMENTDEYELRPTAFRALTLNR